MYHGTSQKFDTLNPKKGTSGAIFFTDDKELAISYAEGAYTSQAGNPGSKFIYGNSRLM